MSIFTDWDGYYTSNIQSSTWKKTLDSFLKGYALNYTVKELTAFKDDRISTFQPVVEVYIQERKRLDLLKFWTET